MVKDESEDTESTPLARSGWRGKLVGFSISIACIAFIGWNIDLNEVKIALSKFDWAYLFGGVASLAAGYSMRVLRWKTLLVAGGAQVSARQCAAPLLGSIALNNVLPMRIGDLVRAFVFPKSIGVKNTTATGSLVMERIIDLMTLLICLGIGLITNPKIQMPTWLVQAVSTLAIAGSLALLFMFFFSGQLSQFFFKKANAPQVTDISKKKRVFNSLATLFKSFESMSRPSVLAFITIFSMFIWLGEAGLYWALLRGFGIDASLYSGIIVMAIVTLSTLVPSSPGYIGPFHLAAYTAISMLGGTPGQAASFAVISHLGVWFPTTLAGAIAIMFNPQLFSRLRSRV
jgi:glycosyltransferase 2 family protein